MKSNKEKYQKLFRFFSISQSTKITILIARRLESVIRRQCYCCKKVLLMTFGKRVTKTVRLSLPKV